jgi:hypothetical protein
VVENGKLCRASEASLVDDANRIAAQMVHRAETRTGRGFGSRAQEMLRACRCS